MQSLANRPAPQLIQPRIRANPWIVLLVLTLGFFMILLDTTIVNIAIPDIEKGLNATFDQILWILNAYLLVYAVLLITAGRLGDMFGPKRLFLTGLVLFTLASAACGLSQNPGELILFRVIQGAGGAILTPQTLSVITSIFPPERRGAAFGTWGAVAGVAAVVGPTLGGFLTTSLSWRAIFYINVPIGIFAVVAAFLIMPEVRAGFRHHLDLRGVLLASAGIFTFVFALIEGQSYSWGPIIHFAEFSIGSTRWALISIYSLLVYGAALFAIFVLLELRTEEPLLPLSLFKDRNFSVANAVSAIVAFAMLGVFVPLTIFLQSVLGFSAVHAGITMIPMSAASMLTAPFAGRLVDRINGKYVLMVGLALFALGLGLVIHTLSLSDTSWSFTVPLLIGGLGMGCTFAPMVTLALREVNPAMAGAASGFINTIRQVGGAVGSAVVGAVLANEVASQLPIQATKVVNQVPPSFRAHFLASFQAASHGSQRFGAGQAIGPTLPPGTSPAVAQHLGVLFHQVFAQAFLNSMRLAMIVPVVALAAGVFVASLMRGGRGATEARETAAPEAVSIAE